jgi:pimeloyl-ACP methyl ester carboxylesterase
VSQPPGSSAARRPAVLLLHGLSTTAATTWGDNGWIDLLQDAGRTVVAPDLMGHGSAPAPHDPAEYADFEGYIERLVSEAVGDEPVDAIGFSLGARTLLAIAAAAPGRFRRLVLSGVGANLFRTEADETKGVMADAISTDAPPDDPQLAYFHRSVRAFGNDPKAIAALLRREAANPWTDKSLASITCPVLCVIGDRDMAGPVDPLVERLTGADVEVVILKDTDHFATPKNFRFLDAALGFLDRP